MIALFGLLIFFLVVGAVAGALWVILPPIFRWTSINDLDNIPTLKDVKNGNHSKTNH